MRYFADNSLVASESVSQQNQILARYMQNWLISRKFSAIPVQLGVAAIFNLSDSQTESVVDAQPLIISSEFH